MARRLNKESDESWEKRKKASSEATIGTFQDSIWAITSAKLDEINTFVERRIETGEGLSAEEWELFRAVYSEEDDEPGQRMKIQDGVASIAVNGVMSKKANLATMFSGGTSMQMLRKDIATALESPSVNAILLDIDSPGGTVDGTKELSDWLFSQRGKKPIAAFTDGMMCSAAMWFGSTADRTFATDLSTVGSIGVATVHYDYSKRDAERGVTRTNIYAGKYKRLASDNAPLSEEGKAYIQSHVDTIYTTFIQDVARNKGISVEAALKMADGKSFLGVKGKDVGLIDEIGTREMAIEWLKQQVKDKKGDTATASGDVAVVVTGDDENSLEGGLEMTLEELKEKHPELVSQLKNEGEATATAKVEQRLEKLETENARLREKDVLRTEREIRVTAEAVWSSALANSTLPERLHGDIRQVVSHEKFIKDGRLDDEGFKMAVTEKVKAWEESIGATAKPASVLGLGTSSRSAIDSQVDLDDDEREMTADEEALVKRNMKLAGVTVN